MNLNRQEMPKQAVRERIKNFNEVALGYTKQQAVSEAERCLHCKKAPCSSACPVNIDIPGFIAKIKEKDYNGAASIIKQQSILPAVCGRVCPQEELCERACILSKKGSPIAIGRLERFAADYQFKKDMLEIPQIQTSTGKRIAIVGSGPSGITAASTLAQLGYKVTLFEALHKQGGVLIYGIPEFRLPKQIVQKEIETLKYMQVEVKLNSLIGRLYTIDELFKNGYSAVYIAIGAGSPRFMGIPGENFNGVLSANEFLTRINLMKAYKFPKYTTPVYCGKRVIVIGGGNVAMDAGRSALRMGAKDVTVVYRRTFEQMPARREEVNNARDEGIKFQLLTNPVQYYGTDKGWVTRAECVKMKLGKADKSGRLSPLPIPGSNFSLTADTVIVAIGTSANPLIATTTSDLKTTEKGYIIVNKETGETSKPMVYAGGDITTGQATVISAMAAAQRTAKAIDKKLKEN